MTHHDSTDGPSLATMENFLLDMDGTIYLGKGPIPGAPEFLRYLTETGHKRLFFTNNPTSDSEQYAAKLAGMGIEAAPGDILTSGEATARYLVSETAFRRVFVLGTPSLEAELCRAGIELTDDNPDAVVLSFDKTLTYAKLETACLLLRDGTPYIATNPDKVCPTDYGDIPDCGAIAALVYEATGRMPKFIGKPNPEMVRMGLDKLGATPENTAMVGDRLYTDMQMAYDSGIASILVLSGEATRDDVDQADRKPDYVIESVVELHHMLQKGDRKET